MTKQLTAQDWGRLIGCKAVAYAANGGIISNGVVVGIYYDNITIEGDETRTFDRQYCQPILRTFDQMTEEEHEELCDIFSDDDLDICGVEVYLNYGHLSFYIDNNDGENASICGSLKNYDWMDSKGFDIRGWIEAGLAIKEGDSD